MILSSNAVIVNKTNATRTYLWPLDFINFLIEIIMLVPLTCKTYMPKVSKIKPNHSVIFNDSCKKIKANIATRPGVITNKGRASLNSRFFIAYITQRKANAFRIDLKNTITSIIKEIFEKSTKKKNIDAKIRLNIDKITVNERAFSLNKTFFSIIAARADKIAAINEK
jgi:hypothetical protein